MAKKRVVIDTNAFVSSLSSKSLTHRLIELLLDETFDIFITNEIIYEYTEVLDLKYGNLTTRNFINLLYESVNVYNVEIYYKWNLLKDEDDNKFVDCYITANADYLVTNDSDFRILNNISFPNVNIITLQEFLNEVE